MTDYFTEIIAMDDLPGSDRALAFLHRLADDVEPLMRNHDWKVPLLVEFYEPGLLGTNTNRGEKIKIRLRENLHGADFYPYSEVLDTMLHELAHNEYDGHEEDFTDFLERLRVEHRRSRPGQPDPVPMYYGRCGGYDHHVASPYGGYYGFGGSGTYYGYGGGGAATSYGYYGGGGSTTATYGGYGEGDATTYGDYGEGSATTTERDYGESTTTYSGYGGTTTTYGDYGYATTTYGDYGADGAATTYDYGQTTTYGDDGEATASYGDHGTATTYGDYGENITRTYGRSRRSSRTRSKGQNCVIC